tara:strand:- start:655 stop:2043 length:1389 start_codon:yes stop_codon:yes gene_type:complete
MINISQIKRAADLYSSNNLAKYVKEAAGKGGMSPGQQRFHKSQETLRLLIAGNQVGKTRAVAAECWFYATSSHPFRPTEPPPTVGWILCADLKAGWRNFSAKLREIEPPGVLHPHTVYDSGRGYTYRGSKMLRLNSGSLMIGKSGSQEQMALAGATIDFLAVDELPKRGHFGEARSRVAVNNAPIFMGFTPIGRPAEWLRDWVDGNPDTGEPAKEPDWDIHRIKLNPENCPHRTAESIEKQIAGYGPWERAQRVEGAWSGVTVDRWISFSEENVFSEIPTGIESLGLGWDHGEQPGSSVCYLVAYGSDRLWVLDAYVSEDRNTPAEEARHILQMLKSWNIDAWQIDEARGDSNSAGRLGLGFSVNQLLERGFAKAMGSARPPFSIQVPYKGPGSVRARARMISSACVEGRFMVHEGCTHLISTLRHWRGETSGDLKHHFDAVGYIAECFLTETLDGSAFLII